MALSRHLTTRIRPNTPLYRTKCIKTGRGGDLRRGAYAGADYGGGLGYAHALGSADRVFRSGDRNRKQVAGSRRAVRIGRTISPLRTRGGSRVAAGATGISECSNSA